MNTQLLVAIAEPYLGLNADALQRELDAAINEHRRRRGLRPLVPDPALAAAARQHSQRMRNLGFFDHIDPCDGTSALERVRAVDSRRWALVAENLAGGQWTAAQVLQGWLDSPGHRVNLEHPRVSAIGTSVALGGPLRTYVTQLYGNDALAAVLLMDPERLGVEWSAFRRRVASTVNRCARR
jgi:uncharacterized protein YkwD